jgi:hypothetical protein
VTLEATGNLAVERRRRSYAASCAQECRSVLLLGKDEKVRGAAQWGGGDGAWRGQDDARSGWLDLRNAVAQIASPCNWDFEL